MPEASDTGTVRRICYPRLMASARAHRRIRFASLTALLLAANASAAPRTPHYVKLEYVLGPGAETTCPGEAMLRHAILSRLDEDPFLPTAKATLRVSIVRVGSA